MSNETVRPEIIEIIEIMNDYPNKGTKLGAPTREEIRSNLRTAFEHSKEIASKLHKSDIVHANRRVSSMSYEPKIG